MIQCFVKRVYKDSFAVDHIPRLVSASNIRFDYSKHTRVLHRHDNLFEILFVRSGSGSYVIENKSYRIQKGDLIICNAGTLHDEVTEENNELWTYSIAIENLKLNSDLPENHLISGKVRPVIATGNYYELFNTMLESIFELLSSGKGLVEELCHYQMMSLLCACLCLINEASDSESAPIDDSALTMKIRKYIDSHYTEDLSLQSISEKFHITAYYLAHIFKKDLSYSPMQYILRRRIGEAQTLLITTNKTITDVAVSVGFNNPNNFNIQFTKYVGLSPREYRKSYTQQKGGK
ncbi:MAG: AraC family transcriptional regulator [Lachnospiraceae bacterium]|jgi:AraC-like DNA-binding protein/mannose-6-phosphate isomerase-like protein (cupin superfamily)|nr:AraC family transcriptional regulator [Lachnospiraceae bacterium]